MLICIKRSTLFAAVYADMRPATCSVTLAQRMLRLPRLELYLSLWTNIAMCPAVHVESCKSTGAAGLDDCLLGVQRSWIASTEGLDGLEARERYN